MKIFQVNAVTTRIYVVTAETDIEAENIVTMFSAKNAPSLTLDVQVRQELVTPQEADAFTKAYHATRIYHCSYCQDGGCILCNKADAESRN